ncbi:MAG: acylneuraminate cytidylyltransferase family protein [Solibacillus sp.]
MPFKRPAELAQDETSGMAPVLHAVEQCMGYDYVVLLQPTSPLRTVEDIDGCIQKALVSDGGFCVSVVEPSHSPYWMYKVENDRLIPLLSQEELIARRQDLAQVGSLNGAVYVGEIRKLLESKSFLTENTLAFFMEPQKSVDIDDASDFEYCEFLLNKRNKKRVPQ